MDLACGLLAPLSGLVFASKRNNTKGSRKGDEQTRLFFAANLSGLQAIYSMENSKEPKKWMSVPAFGDWDMKAGVPDYSVHFSKIRAMRKQRKKVLSWASSGNEDEIIDEQKQPPVDRHPHHHQRTNSDVADLRRPLQPDRAPKDEQGGPENLPVYCAL